MWNTDLSKLYESIILQEEMYATREEPVHIARGTIAPETAGEGLSYRNYKMGFTPPNIAADGLYGRTIGAGEQEEGLDPFSIVEKEYEGDSQINNAVRLALAKVKKLMNHER